MGLRCTVAVPVIVDGRVWGMAAIGSSAPEPLPQDTEARMGDFADLVATADCATPPPAPNSSLTRPHRRRRRRRSPPSERDLHDGAQQRLVSLGLQTRLAEASVPPQRRWPQKPTVPRRFGIDGCLADLQEISRGIHPAILSKGGLVSPRLKTLARGSIVPVALDLAIDRRLPDSVDVVGVYVGERSTDTGTLAVGYATRTEALHGHGPALFGPRNVDAIGPEALIGSPSVSKVPDVVLSLPAQD